MKNVLLDALRICEFLPENMRELLTEIFILDCVDSTNDEAGRALIRAAQKFSAVSGHVYFAEMQTQGRGRNGRQWISPHGCNLYFSLVQGFSQPISQLAGLSLVVGLAVSSVLAELGICDAQLKWPNDVLVGQKKIAGILIETTGDLANSFCAVIGVGLNIAMSREEGVSINQSWISMEEILGYSAFIDRNRVAACLLSRILADLQRLSQFGFVDFQAQWNALDVFFGQPVELRWADQFIEGIAKGVRSDGAFCLQIGSEVKYFLGGDVSLRAKAID